MFTECIFNLRSHQLRSYLKNNTCILFSNTVGHAVLVVRLCSVCVSTRACEWHWLSPLFYPEFTQSSVSPAPLNVEEGDTHTCMETERERVFSSLPGVSPKATYEAHKVIIRKTVTISVCLCAHMCIYVPTKCACVDLLQMSSPCDVVAPERLFSGLAWHYCYSYYTDGERVVFDKLHYLLFL